MCIDAQSLFSSFRTSTYVTYHLLWLGCEEIPRSSCMWYFAMCSRRVHRGSRPRLIFWSLEGPPQSSKPFPSRPQLGSRQGGTGLAGWSAKHSGNAHPAGRCRRFGEHQSGTGGSQDCSLWWRKDVLQHAEDHILRIIFGGPDVFIAKSKSLKPTVRIFA